VEHASTRSAQDAKDILISGVIITTDVKERTVIIGAEMIIIFSNALVAMGIILSTLLCLQIRLSVSIQKTQTVNDDTSQPAETKIKEFN